MHHRRLAHRAANVRPKRPRPAEPEALGGIIGCVRRQEDDAVVLQGNFAQMLALRLVCRIGQARGDQDEPLELGANRGAQLLQMLAESAFDRKMLGVDRIGRGLDRNNVIHG